MKKELNSKLNVLIIFVVTFIVLFFSLKDNFNEIINQIINIDKKFLILAFLLILIYYFLRSIVLNDLISKFNKKQTFLDSFSLTLKTQFFNGVTPFSTGGQPFQVYSLNKEGIKLSNATNIIIQDFIVYQIALVLLGVIAVITNHYYPLFEDVKILKYLVLLGFIINILVTIFLFVLAFTVKINRWVGNTAIKVLEKTKIIKNYKHAVSKWNDYVENFHNGAITLLQNKKQFIKSVFYNFMALCALYLIPLVLLYGMGEFDIINSYEVIITSAYVMLIGSFVPIPGGTGGLEYGFIAFYGNFIKGSVLTSVMLIWRFITYYFGIIIGAIVLNFKKKVK